MLATLRYLPHGVKFAFVAPVVKDTPGRYRKQTTEGVAFLLVSFCNLHVFYNVCIYSQLLIINVNVMIPKFNDKIISSL
jgi:hypothetical protein